MQQWLVKSITFFKAWALFFICEKPQVQLVNGCNNGQRAQCKIFFAKPTNVSTYHHLCMKSVKLLGQAKPQQQQQGLCPYLSLLFCLTFYLSVHFFQHYWNITWTQATGRVKARFINEWKAIQKNKTIHDGHCLCPSTIKTTELCNTIQIHIDIQSQIQWAMLVVLK